MPWKEVLPFADVTLQIEQEQSSAVSNKFPITRPDCVLRAVAEDTPEQGSLDAWRATL